MIVPDAMRPAARLLGEALGFSGHFTAELTDGAGPFWGLHTWAAQPFVDLLSGPTPAAEGYTAGQVEAVRASLILSWQTSVVPLEHFMGVLAVNGLAAVALGGPI